MLLVTESRQRCPLPMPLGYNLRSEVFPSERPSPGARPRDTSPLFIGFPRAHSLPARTGRCAKLHLSPRRPARRRLRGPRLLGVCLEAASTVSGLPSQSASRRPSPPSSVIIEFTIRCFKLVIFPLKFTIKTSMAHR